MQKNLHIKSELVRKAIRVLKENPDGIPCKELAEYLFQMENITEALGLKLLQALLGEDARFQLVDGRWLFGRTEFCLTVSLAETTFVVLDVEIIGRGKSSKIVELAAFKVKGGAVQDEFYSLVNPGRPLSPGWTGPSRFAGEALEQAPDSSVVLQKFADFAENAVLVAHNARFDIRVLNLEWSRVTHFRLAAPVIDTLILFKKWLPGLDAYTLPHVAAYFGIDLPQHHRARSDALTLCRIFNRMLQRLENQGVQTLDQLQDSFLPGIGE
ncbi:MAG: hypothetical protein GXO76_08725 [Calditrichaeota bacterium]|nr:hypothetical protein [Calditrichota bacterium]